MAIGLIPKDRDDLRIYTKNATLQAFQALQKQNPAAVAKRGGRVYEFFVWRRTCDESSRSTSVAGTRRRPPITTVRISPAFNKL
jgi:hypothetical protein